MLPEVPTGLDERRTDLLIQFILVTAARDEDWKSRELGPIHLLKYVYLADLAYAERRDGAAFTGASWQFYHFGPWQPDVYARIEPALSAMHATVKKIPSKYEGDFVRYSAPQDQLSQIEARADKELPLVVLGSIRSAVREFGSDTASLLRHTYLTFPMLHAAPGETLVLKSLQQKGPEPPATETSPVSKADRRRRAASLNALKERVQRRLAQQRKLQSVAPAPRYDTVFQEGTAWLESLAGEPVQATTGEVTVHPDIWTSPQRTEPDVP